ncbi:hypothetical protein BDP27DRAFT_313586 [Rhodocollybia butyracea]|uniref:Uncharacterized protein n=1 Tax=Rhodocollybia butyracea TaxID=206335 RepID=A0A9P5PEC3_9AGAR|nr:hypothetical protein BDP27DRAFT_313586 [Rhodocollybia butyracea]
MTTISIDVGSILREVFLLVTQLKDERVALKEKVKAAQLLVYRALSLHPVLDHMHPPTGMLADVDWYTELRSPLTSGIFKKLGQNEHFKKASLLGDTGTRTRIMMLLLWIIGHRLSEDQVGKLISAAVGEALKRGRTESPNLEVELAQLDSVSSVLLSLKKMIKTKLPLPPDRNPFQGHDFRVEDEDKALPRSELWGYELPEEQQYEYDIRRHPTLLLSPLKDRVIIPQTKLTMLIIQWSACNFGLGKKVYSIEDINRDALWNADPPPAALWELLPDEDEANLGFEYPSGEAPYDIMWQDEPIEDWIHARFCSVYPVHGWAHNSFVRVLLFNTFSSCQALPTHHQVMAAVHVANRLCRQLPSDVWKYAEQFIIARSFLEWMKEDDLEPWDHVFSGWTSEERGMGVIFVDAQKWVQEQPAEYPLSFSDVYVFLTDPQVVCQNASDILSLPLIGKQQYLFDAANHLPDFDANTCTCGECALIHSGLPANLGSFRYQYFVITSPVRADVMR